MIHNYPPQLRLEDHLRKTKDDEHNQSGVKKDKKKKKKGDTVSLSEDSREWSTQDEGTNNVSNGNHENATECAEKKENTSKSEASTSYNEEDFMFAYEGEIEGKQSELNTNEEGVNSYNVSNEEFEEETADVNVNQADEISSNKRQNGGGVWNEVFELSSEDEISEKNDDVHCLNIEEVAKSGSSSEKSLEVMLGNEEADKEFEKKDQINNENQDDNIGDLVDNEEMHIDEPKSEQVLIKKAIDTDSPTNSEGDSEMNILILGQSGVGKSTWVNSIVNYLAYENLEKAEIGGVLSVIPTNFVVTCITDEEIIKQVVEVGEQNANERTDPGKSATQEPQTYTFYLGKKLVRLIDTPGLGDTEGIGRDKEHLNNILNHISFLNEIHGICILLKPNETRFGALFSFCISELLTNLHKNAAKNIVFCFTNSRMTFYAPGETSEVLEQFLADLNLTDVISLSKQTMFCLDNEAFRYLCTLNYENIPKREQERDEYNRSWVKSVAETRRLFDTIKALEPHRVADTTYLCSVRSKLYNLMEPIADISKTIQMNLAIIENQKRKITESKKTMVEKIKKLNLKTIITKSVALDYSQMVCAGEKCISYSKLEASNITITEYPQICHEKCRLRKLIVNVGSDKRLRECKAFNFKGKCKKCKCSWKHHKHQNYIMKKEEVDVIDSIVEDEIVDEIHAKANLEKSKKKMETLTKMYREEQDIILQTCLKFETFLKSNGLSQYSDSFKDYLKDLILQEKRKVTTTLVDEKLLNNLNELLSRYEEEAKKIEGDKENGNKFLSLTSADVIELIEKLYRLRLTGEQIKSNAELTIKSNQRNQIHAEKPLPVGSVSFLE